MFKRIDPCWLTRCVRLLVATLALLTAMPVSAVVTPPNLVLKGVQSFGGTVDSIPIPPTLTGGVTGVETGPVTLSLDPSAVNVFGLDNVYETGFIDVTLLLSSPLFTLLGETPRIRIMESGPASVAFVDYGEHGYDFTYLALLTGGGTVENGLFAGTEFHNINAYDGTGIVGSWIVQPGSTFTWDIQQHGSITFPDGTVVASVGGSGAGIIVPEPSSLAMSGLGMAAIIGLVWRGRRVTRL